MYHFQLVLCFLFVRLEMGALSLLLQLPGLSAMRVMDSNRLEPQAQNQPFLL